jgi:hypothetical protein
MRKEEFSLLHAHQYCDNVGCAHYGPLASMQLEKAKSLDAGNPRVYMQEGITAYFTPAQWGGDKEKGKALMETATAKFETFKPASSIHPNWGKKTNEMFLEMAKKG